MGILKEFCLTYILGSTHVEECYASTTKSKWCPYSHCAPFLLRETFYIDCWACFNPWRPTRWSLQNDFGSPSVNFKTLTKVITTSDKLIQPYRCLGHWVERCPKTFQLSKYLQLRHFDVYVMRCCKFDLFFTLISYRYPIYLFIIFGYMKFNNAPLEWY